jgi:DNA-directed RNA polymerase subunit RPC12/RpoP
MVKQNLVTLETETKNEEKTADSEKKAVYTCGFCGKEFESKLGLKKHLPKCEASPDEPDDGKEETDGMKIFEEDEDDQYECGHCGAVFGKAYRHCPECGEVLEWP